MVVVADSVIAPSAFYVLLSLSLIFSFPWIHRKKEKKDDHWRQPTATLFFPSVHPGFGAATMHGQRRKWFFSVFVIRHFFEKKPLQSTDSSVGTLPPGWLTAAQRTPSTTTGSASSASSSPPSPASWPGSTWAETSGTPPRTSPSERSPPWLPGTFWMIWMGLSLSRSLCYHNSLLRTHEWDDAVTEDVNAPDRG